MYWDLQRRRAGLHAMNCEIWVDIVGRIEGRRSMKYKEKERWPWRRHFRNSKSTTRGILQSVDMGLARAKQRIKWNAFHNNSKTARKRCAKCKRSVRPREHQRVHFVDEKVKLPSSSLCDDRSPLRKAKNRNFCHNKPCPKWTWHYAPLERTKRKGKGVKRVRKRKREKVARSR